MPLIEDTLYERKAPTWYEAVITLYDAIKVWINTDEFIKSRRCEG